MSYARIGAANGRFAHGMCGEPEYICWRHMRDRCYDFTDPAFVNYGARGIKVCDRWRWSFANFIADMGRMPGPRFTIERTDNDKGYEPGNCRWATRAEQQRNKRRHAQNSSGVTGVYWARARSKWVAYINVAHKMKNLGGFDRFEDAVAARRAGEKAYWGVAA